MAVSEEDIREDIKADEESAWPATDGGYHSDELYRLAKRLVEKKDRRVGAAAFEDDTGRWVRVPEGMGLDEARQSVERAAPTDEAPDPPPNRTWSEPGEEYAWPPVEEGERGERLGQGVGWWTRCGNFLQTVGASRPEDHAWVEEARWLLDHFPRRASVYDRALDARQGEGGE